MDKVLVNQILDWAAKQGRGGDTILAHINPQEARLLKRHGGSGKRNPRTGLLSFEASDGSDTGGTDGSVGGTGPDADNSDNSGTGEADSAGTSGMSGLGHDVVDSQGNTVASFESHSFSRDQIDALDQAGLAGVFGGIGLSDPNAAQAAQDAMGAVGLGDFGIGGGAPNNAIGNAIANTVHDILSNMSPISLVEGKIDSIAGVIGSMMSPVPAGLSALSSLAQSVATGRVGETISNPIDSIGRSLEALGQTISTPTSEANQSGNTAPSDSGADDGAGAHEGKGKEGGSASKGFTPGKVINDNIAQEFQRRMAELLQQMAKLGQMQADLQPQLLTLDQLKAGLTEPNQPSSRQ